MKDKHGSSLLKNIKAVANKTRNEANIPATLLEFLSKMVSDLNREFPHFKIEPYVDESEIETHNGDMYIAYIQNGLDILAHIVIAHAEKRGNTLLTQQATAFLLEKVKKDSSYLFDPNIEKIVYFTFDRGNQPRTSDSLIPLLKAVQAIGFKVVEMFDNGPLPPKYEGVESLLDDLSSLKKKQNSQEAGIQLDRCSNELTLTLNKVEGQSSKYYSFYLLAIHVLNHPKLVFKSIDGKKADKPITQLIDIYNKGFYYDGFSMEEEDVIKESEGSYTDKSIELDAVEFDKNGENVLLYGAPGTGKSFKINKNYPHYDRVTFYPDYEYTQFVGGLKPVRDEHKGIDYKYTVGPFGEVLTKAFKNPGSDVGLIVEELNRANAASVFGDMFQLLDRDETGTSSYKIKNIELAAYLDRETGGRYDFLNEGIYIPSNMSIIATMNPSDQGVFPMDSAFKRRWKHKYQPIDWNAEGVNNDVLAGFDKPWPEIGSIINNFLLSVLYVEEDALLGQYYFTDTEVNDIELVGSKLLGYLWNDVARYNRADIFNSEIRTFSTLLSNFRASEAIFVDVLEKEIRA